MTWRLDADPVAIETVNGTTRWIGPAQERLESHRAAALGRSRPAATIPAPGLRDPLDVERLAEAYRRHRGLRSHTDRRSDLCVPNRPHPSHATPTSCGA